MDKTELEAKCASASFDDLSINFAERSVVFRHSVRDADGKILAEFRTEVHVSELQPRPLLHAELRALYCLGLCHCTYVLLLVAKKCQVLQMRACHLSPAEVAFFRDAFSGALAEYFYLADLDLAALKVECCCPPTTDQHLNDPAAATLSVSGAGTSTTPRVLVPFGGGKDSTLLMELVSRMGAEVAWVYYGERAYQSIREAQGRPLPWKGRSLQLRRPQSSIDASVSLLCPQASGRAPGRTTRSSTDWRRRHQQKRQAMHAAGLTSHRPACI